MTRQFACGPADGRGAAVIGRCLTEEVAARRGWPWDRVMCVACAMVTARQTVTGGCWPHSPAAGHPEWPAASGSAEEQFSTPGSDYAK